MTQNEELKLKVKELHAKLDALAHSQEPEELSDDETDTTEEKKGDSQI